MNIPFLKNLNCTIKAAEERLIEIINKKELTKEEEMNLDLLQERIYTLKETKRVYLYYIENDFEECIKEK